MECIVLLVLILGEIFIMHFLYCYWLRKNTLNHCGSLQGNIEDIAQAENMISSRLRNSYESDLQAFAPQSAMFPGLHPMAMMSTVGFGLPRGGGAAGSMGMYGSSPASYPPLYPTPIPGQQGSHASEVCEVRYAAPDFQV